MPIENERKFVLLDDDGARAQLAQVTGVPAASCGRPISTSRACASAAIEADARSDTSSPTSARSTARWSRSRPTSAPADFERLWSQRRETPAEGALLRGRRPLPLGCRFLQDRRRPDLLSPWPRSRCRKTTRAPPPPPAILAPHVLAAGAGRRSALHRPSGWPIAAMPNDCSPTSGRRGRQHEDREHRQPFDQGAVHLRRRADRLRRAQLDDQQHPAGAGRDRHRHHRLGRGLLLRLHRRRAGGARSR